MSGNPWLSPDVDVEGVEAARDDRDIVTLGPRTLLSSLHPQPSHYQMPADESRRW